MKMNLREHGPIKQGLRLMFFTFLVKFKLLREHGPIKQGLRPRQHSVYARTLASQRAWSNKTRIKTFCQRSF